MRHAIVLIVALASVCLAADESTQSTAPRSPAAVAALKKYERVSQQAEQAYRRAIIDAKLELAEELQAAKTTAMRNGSLDEANRIEAAIRSIGGPASPATQTPGKHFANLSQIMAIVPASYYPAPQKLWSPIQADEANKLLAESTKNAMASLSFTIKEIGKLRAGDPGYMAARGVYFVRSDHIRVNTWFVSVWVCFDEDQKDRLAKLSVGDTITAEGSIAIATVKQIGHDWYFAVDLGHCSLK